MWLEDARKGGVKSDVSFVGKGERWLVGSWPAVCLWSRVY